VLQLDIERDRVLVKQKSWDCLRCSILRLPPGLCGCHIIIVVTVAPPPIGIIVLVSIVNVIVVSRVGDRRFVLGERGRWLDLEIIGIVVMLVECIVALELECILLGGQEGL